MKLRKKILLILLAFSLLATGLTDLVTSAVLRSNLRQMAADRLKLESDLIVRQLGHRLLSGDTDISRFVREIAADLNARVSLIDHNGIVLADSEVPDADLPALDNHINRPEIQEALARGVGMSDRESRTLGVRLTYFARTLHQPAGGTDIIRLAVPTRSLEAGMGRLRFLSALMVLAGFLMMSALAWAHFRQVLRPVERIARAADRMASGGYEKSLEGVRGGVEIQGLAASIDRMRRALLDRIGQLAEQHRLLDTVLSGMSEGLLVVDTSRRVMLANAAIRRSLGLGDADLTGRLMAEVIRDPIVGEAFTRTLEDREECRRRVELAFPSERIFELLVEPLDSPDGEALGAIGIFVDVTRLLALEQVRTTFVADLSHEMRTPLASVQAAIETVEDDAGMDEAERQRFFGILRRNVQRIRSLLEDLTDLSKIETGAIPLEIETIPVADLVRDVLASLRSQAEPAGVTLTSDVSPELRLRADRRRLDQILLNVIENAVKFNRPGGFVRVASELSGEKIRIRVEDSGDGIPPADREKVFQRFYRVDRSRSRAAGGRGLGLAIVKHLMRLHGGSVHAEERPGGGTAMILTFPISGPTHQVSPQDQMARA